MSIQGFGGNQPGARVQKMRIDLNKQPKLVCCNCGGDVFVQGHHVLDLSALISPSGKRQPMAVPTGFYCAGCGTRETYILEKDFSKEEGVINVPIKY